MSTERILANPQFMVTSAIIFAAVLLDSVRAALLVRGHRRKIRNERSDFESPAASKA